MINKIKEMLANGEEVRLECVDKNSFIDVDSGYFAIENSLIVGSNLLVLDISELGSIRIKDCRHSITQDEFKYFRIAEDKPIFDDLIDAAIQAVKDDVAIITNMMTDTIEIEPIDVVNDSKAFCKQDRVDLIASGIDWINSLYTETFVIDSEEDTENANADDEVLFTNGEKGLFVSRMEKGKYCFISIDGIDYRIPFSLLKGATVTQKRGK